MRKLKWIGPAIAAAFLTSACDQSERNPVTPTANSTRPAMAQAATPTDTALRSRLIQINQQMLAQGSRVAIEAVEFFTIGLGRPGARLHQTGLRWVPNDGRRLADGINITYLVDQSNGATASGLTAAQTEAAMDDALTTWGTDAALKKVQIIKRADTGADPTVFDSFFGFGGFGDPFLADIVEAGFYPRAFFEAVGGPGGGRGILAFSVSFIFVDGAGNPTDVNGDRFLDTALNEVYYNNTFGDPADDRVGNPWGINIPLPGIDVETVAVHENGHSLELGHFGAPPVALMNPVYAGIRQLPFAPDDAGMNAVWGSWPNP
jgi:hypothetical protein